MTPLKTPRLILVPQTVEQVRAQIATMPADQRAHVSPNWLAQLDSPSVDHWTLGFAIVHRDNNAAVGHCGYKGPPDADGVVEIAYGLDPGHQGKGYATEAAEALVTFAFDSGRVRLVCAHTLPQANASTRVLAKCGFQNVGEVIDPEDGPVWRWERSR